MTGIGALFQNTSLGYQAPALQMAGQAGSANSITRGAALTGVADGQRGTMSCWHNPITSTTALKGVSLIRTNTFTCGIYWNFTGANFSYLTIAASSGFASYYRASTTTSFPPGNGWNHFLFSYDTSGTNAQIKAAHRLYINDVAQPVLWEQELGSAFTVQVATGITNWYYLDSIEPTETASAMAEPWFMPDVYMDFDDAFYRRKFINANLTPADLGNGEKPTGTKPAIYFKVNHGYKAVNLGTGGNFNAAGTQTTVLGPSAGYNFPQDR